MLALVGGKGAPVARMAAVGLRATMQPIPLPSAGRLPGDEPRSRSAHAGGCPGAATIPLGSAGVIGAIDHASAFGPVATLLFIIATFVLSRAACCPQRLTWQAAPDLSSADRCGTCCSRRR